MPSIFDWSSTAGSNTTVDGTNIAEGCPAGNVNNALRSVMALCRSTFTTALQNFLAGSAPLPEANGGTGQTTLAAARGAMGAAASGNNSDILQLSGLTTPLSLAQGGTGTTTLANLYAALGFTVSGSASSGKAVFGTGGLVLTWRDYTLPSNSAASYAYGSGHTYASFAKGWFNGDDGSGSIDCRVVSAGTSTATIANTSTGVASGTLFSIGI